MNAYERWFAEALPGRTHAAGLLMQETEIGDVEPHYLYRLFNADNTLLYVGVARDFRGRLSQHSTEKGWWPEVTRKTVALYLSKDTAHAAETLAIHNEKPLYNERRPAVVPRLSFSKEFGALQGDQDPESFLVDLLAFVCSATSEDVAAWHAHMTITGAKTLATALSHGKGLAPRAGDLPVRVPIKT